MAKNKPFNTQISNQLSSIRMSSQNNNNSPYAIQVPLDHSLEENVHFINISLHSSLELGKMLSPDHFSYDKKNPNKLKTFSHPIFGEFTSITNLRCYLNSFERNEYYRHCTPMQASTTAYKNKNDHIENVENANALLAYAIWIKVSSDQKVCELLRNSELPFDCFKLRTRVEKIGGEDVKVITRHRQKFSPFYVTVYDRIRSALLLKTEPSFEDLRDNPNGNIYAKYASFELCTPKVVEKKPEPKQWHYDGCVAEDMEIGAEEQVLSEEELNALDERVNGNIAPVEDILPEHDEDDLSEPK